jgi:transposase
VPKVDFKNCSRRCAGHWFSHGDVLVLDNAAIHTGGSASHLADLLWDVEVDGSPLNVLVLPLPTCSPELNPIELVFHILARRLRSNKYISKDVSQNAVEHQVSRVMADLSMETVLKCAQHSGY